MTTIYLATLVTAANGTFEAIGRDVEEARRTLTIGLFEHGRQRRLPRRWWTHGDIRVRQYHAGVTYRDRLMILTGPQPIKVT